MKRKGSSNSCVTRNLRRARRVLVAAGVLALGVGLWPSAAQAKIICKIVDYRVCSDYTCCLQTCVECIDTLSGDSDDECSDPTCWDKFN